MSLQNIARDMIAADDTKEDRSSLKVVRHNIAVQLLPNTNQMWIGQSLRFFCVSISQKSQPNFTLIAKSSQISQCLDDFDQRTILIKYPIELTKL